MATASGTPPEIWRVAAFGSLLGLLSGVLTLIQMQETVPLEAGPVGILEACAHCLVLAGTGTVMAVSSGIVGARFGVLRLALAAFLFGVLSPLYSSMRTGAPTVSKAGLEGLLWGVALGAFVWCSGRIVVAGQKRTSA